MTHASTYAREFLTFLLFACFFAAVALPGAWAAPALPEPEQVTGIANKVAEWQLSRSADPEARYIHGSKYNHRDWLMGACYTGISKYAGVTQQDRYWEQLRDILINAGNKWRLGPSRRHADDHAIGYAYGQLYKRFGQPEMLAPMIRQFDELAKLPYDESLQWKDNIATREWAWCDALFMAPPTLFQLSEITGDPKYAAQSDRLWWKTTDYLFNKEHRLYHRDSSFFDKKERNGEPVFWSRGNGWVAAGMPRIMETLADDDPRREKYVDLYKQMMGKLIEIQKPDGYWPSGLLDGETWQQPESSGTAFFTYALLWGINHGVLDRDHYLTPALKGWEALTKVVQPSGKVGWVQRVGAAPGSTGPDQTEPYAVGGFLLAASEMYKLALLDGAPVMTVRCENALEEVRHNETIEIPWAKLESTLGKPGEKQIVVLDNQTGQLLLSQIQEASEALGPAMLLFQADFGPNSKKQFSIYAADKGAPKPAPRVFGKLVPGREDFAWENDRIAFRVYGPAIEHLNETDSGVDVWTKSVRHLIIDKWYAGDDYHTDHGEGLDYYKVSKSRGAGGLGLLFDGKLYNSGEFKTAEVLASGPLRFVFKLEYGPWETPAGPVRETKVVSIDAGSNLTRYQSQLVADDRNAQLPAAVGLVLREAGQTSFSDDWIGHWDTAKTPDGHTGVGVVIVERPFEVVTHEQTSRLRSGDQAVDSIDKHALAVTAVPSGKTLTYYAGAGWSKSPDFPTAGDWFQYLSREARRLASPITVRVAP